MSSSINIITAFLLLAFNATSTAQEINFSDPNLLTSLLLHQPQIDLDNNNKISEQEASLVTQLNLSGKSISSALELDHFIALEKIDISFNTIDTLNVAAWPNLKYFKADQNKLKAIDFNSNPELHYVSISYNDSVHHLHLDKNPKIDTIYCAHSHVHHMKLYNCHLLSYLDCSHNMMDTMNFQANPLLKHLDCHGNKYKQLVGIETLKDLIYLDTEDTKLTQLDLSGCADLKFAFIGTNPNLPTICVNSDQYVISQNCAVNSCFTKDLGASWSTQCSTITSLESHPNENVITYPNPSTGKVNFYSPIKSITNAMGQQLPIILNGRLTVDLSEYGKGWYVLHFENKRFTKVLIL